MFPMTSGQHADRLAQLDQTGLLIVEHVVDPEVLTELIAAIERSGRLRTHALRQLHQTIPEILRLAKSPAIRALVEPLLGAGAFVARSLYFDKTPSANWQVAWHQDLTIAVRERVEAPGFGPWSVKQGVVHVQPPARVLEQMLTVRLHLDDCDATNGALQVLPGSHHHGRLVSGEIEKWRNQVSPVTCSARRGEAVLMRPLLLHSSAPARHPSHRRVIHLEFAADVLPDGLDWFTGQTS